MRTGQLGKLAITDAFNSTNTQTCTYTHDDLARIASGNCGSVWSQTFSYDAFGNLTKTGSSQFQPTYSYLTNQMSSIGSFTPSYDANGDVTNDSLNSYAWDVEGRPTTIDGITVTYDALERLVEQDQSGSYTQIVYDCLGNKLALMNTASTEVKSFVPLPGGGTAVYAPGGLQYYRHPDWLGSSRFASTPSRTMYNDLAYAPFGEQYASTGTMGVTNTSFARMNQNIATSVYDAMYREYGIQGRWPSPDPAGMAAANPANPQSWNRYAYVLNKPLTLVDPNGMGVECIGGTAFDVESTYSDGQLVDTTYTPLGSCPDGGGGDQSGGGGGGNGSPRKPSILSCTVQTSNKLTISNAIAQIPGVGKYLQPGSWARAGLDLFGGNAISGLLGAGQTLFGNSASSTELGQTFVGIMADPSMGFNPAIQAVGGQGIPSALEAVESGGGALTDAAAEGATGIGLLKLGVDALLTVGSAGYCLVTH